MSLGNRKKREEEKKEEGTAAGGNAGPTKSRQSLFLNSGGRGDQEREKKQVKAVQGKSPRTAKNR